MGDQNTDLTDSKFEIDGRKDVSSGDWVVVTTKNGDKYHGTLMPGYVTIGKQHVVLKLKSGYNFGIRFSNVKSIQKSDYNLKPATNLAEPSKRGTGMKYEDMRTAQRIVLIGTGGTIASRIDYRTGGVTAALSASEIYAAVPELRKYASIDSDFMFNEYSENLEPHHWTKIADRIAEKVRSATYRGIVVLHGTDTMHYTSAAMSFALRGIPIPVVLVGSQRSSDRPSSDGALNLICAVRFAIESPYAGVFVAMHGSTSDDFVSCHLGTRVRKNHTSRRSAFESIDRAPIAIVNSEVAIQSQDVNMEIPKRSSNLSKVDSNGNERSFIAYSKFDPRVTLLKYHPAFDPNLITSCVQIGCKAIILEGTGLGHVGRKLFPALSKALEDGVMIFMTSQCIWGRTNMKVYDTGRDLLKMGVIPLADMTPETALVKAMWVIANSRNYLEAVRMMQKNIANEISPTSPITRQTSRYKEGYPV